MREILYRARERVGMENGQWCYGQPYRYRGTWLMCDAAGKLRLIDPKTICEWTGLHDMGGKQIFEGDRLSGLVPNNGLVPHYPSGALLEADVVVMYSAEGVEGAGWYVSGKADGKIYCDRLCGDYDWSVTGDVNPSDETEEET